MSIGSVSNPYQSYNANTQNSLSQMQNDFQQLGQALQSGNTSAAQQDYSNIQQFSRVLQAYKGHHGHHGNQSGENSSVNSSSASSISNPSSSSAQSSSTASLLLSSIITSGANQNSSLPSSSNASSSSTLSSSAALGLNQNSGLPSSLNASSNSDDNIVGQSMQSLQSVISQYLSNSMTGGLSGASGLLSNVLGSINISV